MPKILLFNLKHGSTSANHKQYLK